jgi:pimeloyl-ACP methyl ester carboxylesterase
MVLIRSARRWWTQSNPSLLIESQDKLLKSLVNAPFERKISHGVNGVEFSKSNSNDLDTVVLAHGFGSGLGFFYQNVDDLLAHPSVGCVMLVDWLGMGGSDRPQCSQRPIRGWTDHTTSWCDSRYTPSKATDFFVKPFADWLHEAHGTKQSAKSKLILVGHRYAFLNFLVRPRICNNNQELILKGPSYGLPMTSLGGYLSARFVMAYPGIVDKLVLASPVGFPNKPEKSFKGSQLPTSFRILDALWSGNITPQQLVRSMGSTRGKRNTKRALQGRIPHLTDTDSDLLADYLYHITVADPSGEFAMNSLLEPIIAPDLMGVFAREALEERFMNMPPTTKSIKVLFGDNDWMRPNNESSARSAMGRIQDNYGIRTSVDIIPNAGHHLYMDNGKGFVKHIID